MKLVRVTFETVPHCVQLAKELVDASSHPVPFDWDFAYASGAATLSDPNYYSAMIEVDGVFAGMVLGGVMPFYFNKTRFGNEDAWFVRPGTRDRTRAAVMLMRGFIEWCKKHGAIQVMATDNASIEPLRADRLYKHLGYKRYGATYCYSLGDEPCPNGQPVANQIT